jgi:hypothetical protein
MNQNYNAILLFRDISKDNYEVADEVLGLNKTAPLPNDEV